MDSIRDLLDLMEDLESNPETGDILDFEFGDDVLVETRVVENRDGDLLLEMDMDALEYLGRQFTFEDAEWQGVAEDTLAEAEYNLPSEEKVIDWFTGELKKVESLEPGFTNEIMNQISSYGRPGLSEEIREIILNYIKKNSNITRDNKWHEAEKDLTNKDAVSVIEGFLGGGSRGKQQPQKPYFTPNDVGSAEEFLKSVHALLEIEYRNKSYNVPRIHINDNFDPRPLSDAQLAAVESAMATVVKWKDYYKAPFEKELMPKINMEKQRRASFTGADKNSQNSVTEAEYRGRKVSLGKPFLTPDGPKKRSVYVKNPKGNVVKVNFGQKGVKIKKNNPARRKSFRARHGCDNPGPRHKAKFWSCKFW